MKLKNIILNVICLLITNLNAMSLREYIAQHGMPEIDEYGSLDLSYKNLTDLDGLRDIPRIEQINTLHLNNNKLTKLPNNIFDRLTKLMVLNLYHNELRKLPDNIFNGLRLSILNLSNNKLRTLPNNIFNGIIQFIEPDVPCHIGLSQNPIKLTRQEFIDKFLTALPYVQLHFKTEEQEAAEAVQRELIVNIKSGNIAGINSALTRLKAIKQENPDLYVVSQSDEKNDDNALHLALTLGDINLAKNIFDIMPEYMHETNKQGKTPMHLLVLFRHVPDRYDSIAISDEAERSSKNEEYNIVLTIVFLKYIFIQDTSLVQLLYQPDNEGINPIESLIPAAREDLMQILMKFKPPVTPASDLNG